MREIKFRVWDKESKNLINPFHGDFFCIDEEGAVYKEISSNYDELELIDVTENVEIMQCIGLKDKNCNDIYEGDILCDENEETKEKCLFEVRYAPARASFVAYDLPSRFVKAIKDLRPLSMYSCSKLEIVGNIYENPELLEGEKGA